MRAKGLARASRLLVTVGVVSAIVVMMTTSAWAGHAYIEISIPVDTVVEAPADSTTQLAMAEVPEDFAGHACEVRAHAENQISVHPGNDLVVASGNSQVLLSDVEAERGQVIETDDLLELGAVITVSLIMGPDEVFSAGIEVIVECFSEETTTTVEVLPTEATTTTVEVLPTEVTTTTVEVLPTEVTTTTVEVLPTEVSTSTVEVLPLTGPEDSVMGLLALALLAGGTLLVVGTRRTED